MRFNQSQINIVNGLKLRLALGVYFNPVPNTEGRNEKKNVSWVDGVVIEQQRKPRLKRSRRHVFYSLEFRHEKERKREKQEKTFF